ncbi:MAG: MurR/RpiR family transcriptional regulator [Lactobacillales bacterium]|nr:MurR/RpiR family transcriptional regulator [Lactobacillales bacterium]
MATEKALSDSEKFLWEYIESHVAEIPNLSIVKLSEQANVSTATIVRTMKKKGYEGFTSFKHHLKERSNAAVNFSGVEKIDAEIKQAILKNEQEVVRTINRLDSGTIEDAIQKIKASSRIFIFARGFSELIAEEMNVKFQLLDKYSEKHTDPNIITSMSKKIDKKDIVVFISLGGETPELVTALKNCLKNGVSTITITANGNSPLARLSEIVFTGFKSEGSYFPEYEVRSRLPLSVIARILLDSYAIRTN